MCIRDSLGVHALLEWRGHAEHAVHALEKRIERGAVAEVAAHDLDAARAERPRLVAIGVARQRAHREAVVTKMLHDGAALLTRSPGDENRLLRCHEKSF